MLNLTYFSASIFKNINLNKNIRKKNKTMFSIGKDFKMKGAFMYLYSVLKIFIK